MTLKKVFSIPPTPLNGLNLKLVFGLFMIFRCAAVKEFQFNVSFLDYLFLNITQVTLKITFQPTYPDIDL